MIRFDAVTKQFPDGTTAVDDLSLTAPTGKITVLVGPSGCGKTTSLRMVNRMIEPTRGSITLDGQDTGRMDEAELRRGIGYVIQHAGLFPHRTVLDNIATVPRLLGWDKKRTSERSRELLERVGLDPELGDRYPVAALGWSAAARRRGPGARRRPAGDAHGRAVLGRRPRGARPAPGRVPPAPGRARQDDRLRHPRHRRGHQARRPGRGAARRRQARPGRRARLPPGPPGRRLRRRLRRARPRLPRAAVPAGARACRCAPSRPCVIGEVADGRGADWLLVVDDERQPLGWVEPPASAGAPSTRDDLHRGGTVAREHGSLRGALDAALSSPSRRGVIVDESGALCGTVLAHEVLTAIEETERPERDEADPVHGGAASVAGDEARA